MKPSRIRTAILSTCVLLPCTALSVDAAAQRYPEKAVRVIVPFPTGKICG